MTSLGFENYAEALKIYLSKYREVSSMVLFTTFLHEKQILNWYVFLRPNLQEGKTRTGQPAVVLMLKLAILLVELSPILPAATTF